MCVYVEGRLPDVFSTAIVFKACLRSKTRIAQAITPRKRRVSIELRIRCSRLVTMIGRADLLIALSLFFDRDVLFGI